MKYDLTGRVALVTGASRGLGAAIAGKLGRCRAKVAVNYFGSPDKARRVAEDICQAGSTAEAFKADVRDEQQVAELVRQVRQVLGPIDVLVVNATGPQPFLKIEEQ